MFSVVVFLFLFFLSRGYVTGKPIHLAYTLLDPPRQANTSDIAYTWNKVAWAVLHTLAVVLTYP